MNSFKNDIEKRNLDICSDCADFFCSQPNDVRADLMSRAHVIAVSFGLNSWDRVCMAEAVLNYKKAYNIK